MDTEVQPMAVFVEELRSDDIQLRLEGVRKLGAIAKALGPEKTRDELLKFITGTTCWLCDIPCFAQIASMTRTSSCRLLRSSSATLSNTSADRNTFPKFLFLSKWWRRQRRWLWEMQYAYGFCYFKPFSSDLILFFPLFLWLLSFV